MFNNIKFLHYFANLSLKSLVINIKRFINKNQVKQLSIPLILTSSIFILKNNNKNMSLKGNVTKTELSGFENLKDGEMREYKYGSKDGESILIIKYQDKFYATNNYCPHYGAPLHTGL